MTSKEFFEQVNDLIECSFNDPDTNAMWVMMEFVIWLHRSYYEISKMSNSEALDLFQNHFLPSVLYLNGKVN